MVPLLSRISKRFGVDPRTTLCALLVASNLGGASLAFGDGPAIMQREIWGFNPAVFAAAMVPRNALLVTVLTALTAWLTWWPLRTETPNWEALYHRLKVRDQIGRDAHHKRAVNLWPAIYAGLGV
jgi:Na+/H+ antiporter NhaD/arsenite permease-like protein